MNGPNTTPVIDVAITEKTWRDTPVLRDLVFNASRNEVVCIVGPSGSGKSTLLGLLAGLDTQFSGRIDVQGEGPPGVVFQQPRLLPWMTVRENVLLSMGDEKPAYAERARMLLAELGIDQVADRFPRELSLGMQRRAALARALLAQPEVLLLDEPFVSLDAPTAERARQILVREQQSAAAATVLFTHDLHEAAALGDRLLFLSEPPSSVMLEVTPSVDDEVESFCEALTRRHPGVLQGRAGIDARAK